MFLHFHFIYLFLPKHRQGGANIKTSKNVLLKKKCFAVLTNFFARGSNSLPQIHL